MKKDIYLLFLFFAGLYLIVDGLGSILIYHTQPLFPDHFMRIIRSALGLIIAYIGFNLYTKK